MTKTISKRMAGSGSKTRRRPAAAFEASVPHLTRIEKEIQIEDALDVPKAQKALAVREKNDEPKNACRAA